MPKSKHRKKNRRPVEDFKGEGAEPLPTDSVPRSEDRLNVYAARVAARRKLFSSRDSNDSTSVRGVLGDKSRNGKPVNSGDVVTQAPVARLRPHGYLPATFGARLRVLRLRRGLSMRQLGELIEMSFTSVCKLENGDRDPSIETARALAAVFGVTLDVLWGPREN